MHLRIIGASTAFAFLLPLSAFAAMATIVGTPSSSAVVGTTVSFNVATDGFAGTQTFSVRDSFYGSSVQTFNITNSGNFNWMPKDSDVGNHILTITASDGFANSTAQYRVFVNAPASAEIQSLNPGTMVNPGQTVTFNVVARGFGAPNYSVADSFSGSSLATSSISNSGYFTWVPVPADAGTHGLIVTVTDPQGHSATASTTLTVPFILHVTVGGPSVAMAGSLVTLTLSAPGFTNPQFSVRDVNSASSVSVGTVGTSTFMWTPLARDAGSHILVITASDPLAHTSTMTYALEVRAASSTPSAPSPSVPLAPGPQAASFVFVSYLHVGSRGAEVTALQQKLAALGFLSSEPTGYYGSMTQAAVRAFQQAHGLEMVGYVGPGTRAALNK